VYNFFSIAWFRTGVTSSVDAVQSLTTRQRITMALVTIRLSVQMTTMNMMNGCFQCDSDIDCMLGVGFTITSFILSSNITALSLYVREV